MYTYNYLNIKYVSRKYVRRQLRILVLLVQVLVIFTCTSHRCFHVKMASLKFSKMPICCTEFFTSRKRFINREYIEKFKFIDANNKEGQACPAACPLFRKGKNNFIFTFSKNCTYNKIKLEVFENAHLLSF